MVHMQSDPLALDFVSDNLITPPPPNPNPPFLPSSITSAAMITKSTCVVFHTYKGFTIRAICGLSSLSLSLNSTVAFVMSLRFPPLHSRLINLRTHFCSHLFKNRNSGSETGYMYFAPDGKSAQCRHDYSEHFSLLAASCPFLLREVINYHHLPSNTQAAAQTGTPGPPLELWATYSPAGITQTAA